MTLVCWSGGCDSTLALYDVAKAEGNTARAISVVHKNIARNDEAKAARTKLLRRFKRLGLTVHHTIVEINHDGDFDVETPVGLYQPTIWLSAAMPFLGGKEDLCFGYIKGDDFWHHRGAFVEAFCGCQRIRYGDGVVRFPLEWDTKADVIRRLRALGLYSACWWCESSTTGRPCQACHPCETHATALWQIDRQDKAQRRKKPKEQPGL